MAQQESMKAVPAAFIDAWNRHDTGALAALFTEDAHFVNVVGAWWNSRSEIEAAHRATHATIFKNSHLEGDIDATTELAPGVVALHVSWRLSGMTSSQGNPVPLRRGILMFVLARDPQAGWRIRIAQNTDIVEGAIAPPPAA